MAITKTVRLDKAEVYEAYNSSAASSRPHVADLAIPLSSTIPSTKLKTVKPSFSSLGNDLT